MWKVCAALLVLNCLALAVLIGLNAGKGDDRPALPAYDGTELALQIQTPVSALETAQPAVSAQPEQEQEQVPEQELGRQLYVSSVQYMDMDWKSACARLMGEGSERQVRKQNRFGYDEYRLEREDGGLFLAEHGRIAHWKDRTILPYSQLFLDAVDALPQLHPSRQTAARRDMRRMGLEQEIEGISREWAAQYAEELVTELIGEDVYRVEAEQIAVYTVSQMKRIRTQLRDAGDYIAPLEDLGADCVYRVRLRGYIGDVPCYSEGLDPLFQSGKESIFTMSTEFEVMMTEKELLEVEISYLFVPEKGEPVEALRWEEIVQQNGIRNAADAGEPIYIVLVSGTGKHAQRAMKPVYRMPCGDEAVYYDAQTGEQITRPVYEI